MQDINCLFACSLKALIPTLLPRGEGHENPSPCGRGEGVRAGFRIAFSHIVWCSVSESKNSLTLTLSQRERERLMMPART